MNETVVQSKEWEVNYRRAHVWQIILVALNGLNGMSVYFLVGLAAYSANVGYGIATLAVGGILTFTRIFDAITDPLLAFVYDRVNTPWGKVRPLIIFGGLIQSLGLLSLFHFFSSKGFGPIVFILCYMVYVIGYTMVNMTVQTLPALMTNDPKQRPTISVWQTAFNYLTPMALNVIVYTKLLPIYGSFNQPFLTLVSLVCVGVSWLGMIAVCIGISAYDKPENFKGIGRTERLKICDMVEVLRNNKPLTSYIISASSDKIAQQTASVSLVGTMLNGILIGDMGLGTVLSVIGVFPSLLFGIIGARYAGRKGHKEAIVSWTWLCILANVAMIAFFTIANFTTGTQIISRSTGFKIAYIFLTFLLTGFGMCVTVANAGFMADIIDYELDRSGRYVPAVVTGTYSLIDKLVSSVSVAIASAGVALIGYHASLPQPTDPSTAGVFWMTMILRYGLSILGFLCTIWAMRSCRLDRAAMVDVQKRIQEKKQKEEAEYLEKELHRGDAKHA